MNKISASLRGLLLVFLILGIGVCLFFLGRQPAEAQKAAVSYELRAGIIGLALAGWYLSQSLIGSRGPGGGGIGDALHELSAPLHRYFFAHPRWANAVLIVSSALIDVLGLFLILASIFGPSIRPFAGLLILFIMRQACQSLCALPAPPGMIWRNPGFPSLLVTYGVANDFFFSGHTAIAVLGAIEIARLCPWWLGLAAAAIAVFEAGVVLVFRAHYTMDIFTAAVAAFCAAGLAGWLCSVL
jgi:hypothetical protein